MTCIRVYGTNPVKGEALIFSALPINSFDYARQTAKNQGYKITRVVRVGDSSNGFKDEDITESFYKKAEKQTQPAITLKVNNNGTIKLNQAQIDGRIALVTGRDGATETEYISPGDMVMLLNWYRYVKTYDIQNDFINPYGKNERR